MGAEYSHQMSALGSGFKLLGHTVEAGWDAVKGDSVKENEGWQGMKNDYDNMARGGVPVPKPPPPITIGDQLKTGFQMYQSGSTFNNSEMGGGGGVPPSDLARISNPTVRALASVSRGNARKTMNAMGAMMNNNIANQASGGDMSSLGQAS